MRTSPPVHRIALAALAALFAYACVDSPAAPDGAGAPSSFLIAPVLSLAGPDGAPAKTAAQSQALKDAFQKVDRFQVRVTRGDGTLVLDTAISVTPGQPEYDFQLPVQATPGETLTVILTAFQGQTELFQSPPVTVQAQSPTAAGGAPPAPADITLSYSGPGAAAASVTLSPEALVLGPGGSSALSATVLNEDGGTLNDVPLEWASSAAGVVQVDDDGSVSARSGGQAEVVVTTPTGLEARARVYVVGGTLAYVEGGVLKTRPAAGGTVALQGGSSASGPAWSADGSMLFYSEAGSVRRAPSNRSLVEGTWPTVSLDGTKLAFERSGRIWVANLGGTLPREGPSGSTPVWTGTRELVVGGGSIQRVDVDGEGRTTVVSGEASLPAVGPSGTVAYVAGGELRLQGGAEPLAAGVSGRPTWSPGGAWLAVASGEGIVVVPADGSGPALPLPGLGAAAHPAFQPQGALASPPAVGLTGLDPDPALPGQPVRLLGSGFDDIILANNRVFWPTPGGAVEVTVTDATSGALSTVVPPNPAKGEIQVTNQFGQATLAYEPTLGVLEIRTATPFGRAVPGVGVTLTDGDGGSVADGRTDDGGSLVLPGLPPGVYDLVLDIPEGFDLEGAATRTVEIGTGISVLELTLVPVPARVEVTPHQPVLTVGQSRDVSLTAYDVNGTPIEQFASADWRQVAQGRLGVQGSGLKGTIQALSPSARSNDAVYSVFLNGKAFYFLATITTSITGTVGGTLPKPVAGADGPAAAAGSLSGIPVQLLDDHGTVLARTNTDQNGQYAFSGLFQGGYEVRLILPDNVQSSPETAFVNLNDNNVRGRANFTVSPVPEDGGATRRPGDIVIFQDYTPWGNQVQDVLAGAPFHFTGSDYDVLGTSTLLSPIPATTSVAILSSLSSGSSPLTNVNSATAQANLESWVANGGWLLVHAADNVAGGYQAPGLDGIADDQTQCEGLKPVVADHPFIRGPDGLLGTADDVTDAAADMDSGCYDNHGALDGILPPDALVLLVEQNDATRPTYATYPYGSGRVVVTTQTLEFDGHSTRNVINHLWWTLMGGVEAPSLEAPALRLAPEAAAGADAAPWSDVPAGGPGGE